MPEEQQASLRFQGGSKSTGPLPGLWPGLAIAVTAALLSIYWFQADAGSSEPAAAAAVSGQITEVSASELLAALDTVEGSREQLARIRDGEACAGKLASVVITLPPGHPPGRIRLQSGSYISPAFDVTPAPTRVALPFPAPYAAGTGTIAVLGTTTGAVVALTPPWQLGPQPGAQFRKVTWTPASPCAGPKP